MWQAGVTSQMQKPKTVYFTTLLKGFDIKIWEHRKKILLYANAVSTTAGNKLPSQQTELTKDANYT